MPPSALALGAVIHGEYALEEKLGGSVYRALRTRDSRELAVRVLYPSSPELAEEQLSLAEAASRVHHPALASVEGCGRLEDGGCYIATEWVPGQRLDEWADEVGIPPLSQVVDLISRLCAGLQAAARAGVVHDALNPRNIRVPKASTKQTGSRSPMKLLDLGVAALCFTSHADDSRALHFVAPEQLAVFSQATLPRAFRCSPTMNVFSCGSLLYYLTTGGPPFAGTTPMELHASQQAGRLVPPARINPQISLGLNAVIMRALAFDPSARFVSVAELGDALTGVRGSVPLQPRSSQHPPVADEGEGQSESADGPPTFKAPRLLMPMLVSDAAVARERYHDVPTEPPGALSTPSMGVQDMQAGGSGVAPIGLFSSSPPIDRRSSLPAAALLTPSTMPKGTPIALFSQPPPAPSVHALVDALAETQPGRFLDADTAPVNTNPGRPAPSGLALIVGGVDDDEDADELPTSELSDLAMALGREPRPLGRTLTRGAMLAPPLQAVKVEHIVGIGREDSSQNPREPQEPGVVDTGSRRIPGARVAEPFDSPSAYAPLPRARSAAWLRLALPLAAGACVIAFLTVRKLASPAQPPLPTSQEFQFSAPPAVPSAEPTLKADLPTGAELHEPATPSLAEDLEPNPAGPLPLAASSWRARERLHHGRGSAAPSSRSSGDAAPAVKAPEPTNPSHDEVAEQPEDLPQVTATEPPPPPPAPARITVIGFESNQAKAPTSLGPHELKPPTPHPAGSQPLTARAIVSRVETRGSLPTSLVRRAVERIRPQFTACYERAAQAAGHHGFSELIVEVTINERGRASGPSVNGGQLPRLDACVADAVTKLICEKAPDTGTVLASWKVTFTP